MKKIILLFILLTTTLFAEIDEYKTDIYFGNGIWNTIKQARKNREKLEKKIIDKKIIKGDPKLQKRYGEVILAYNWGQGNMTDALETYYQLKKAGQVNDMQFFAVMDALTGGNQTLALSALAAKQLIEPFTKDWEQGNVDEMLEEYKRESFSKSHRVLLVSHSQGNLFANRIYNALNPKGYQGYFANLQVATPVKKINAPLSLYVNLIGDPILAIPGSLHGNVKVIGIGHKFLGAYLNQKKPYEKIVKDLKILLPLLDISEGSQWKMKELFNYGTKKYRIKVEHMFDPSVTVNSDVFPFKETIDAKASSKKLYFVENPYNTYVMAGFGGTQILNFWEGQKKEQHYKLEGTDPVEYIEFTCKDPSTFEILSHQNINTKEWRVTVKNKDTNETQEGVYPFNLKGSLYELESGRWVLASCGGESIEEIWDGQQPIEKLAGSGIYF